MVRSNRCVLLAALGLLLAGCADPGGSADGSAGGTETGSGGVDGTNGGGDADSTGGADDDDTDDDADADDDGTATDGTGDDDSGDDGGGRLCGNGELDPGEECDDGNDDEQDWCTASCEVASCGDGIVWTAAETCDDGNLRDGDGCSSACGLDSCGDAVVDPGEQCDLGDFNGTNGSLCSSVCVSAGVALAETRAFRVNQTRYQLWFPDALAVADFNDDGLLDAAVGTRSSTAPAVTLVYGQGGGEFWPAYEVRATEGYGVQALEGGQDLDGDGRPDLVALLLADDGTSLARTHLGGGAAVNPLSFQERALTRSTGFIVGDATGDGLPDLVTMWTEQNTMYVAEGLGTGAFEAPFTVSTVGAGGGEGPVAVALGDVSGDGVPDIAAVTELGDLVILRGSGVGSFLPPQIHTMATTGLSSVRLADVDGDGLDDAIALVPGQNEVAVALSVGDGTFSVTNDYPTAGGPPRALAIVELDGDGDPDIVTADAGSLSVFHGTPGGGGFGLPELYDFSTVEPSASPETTGIVVADLDEDGLDDVIVDGGPFIVALLSDEDGGLESPRAYRPGFRNCCDRGTLVAADFSGDGHVDLAVGYLHSFNVLAGDGAGRLLPAFTEVGGGTNPGVRHIAVGNLDGSGPPDLGVSASNGHVQATVGASGWFELAGPSATSAATGDVVLADLDGDGLDDRVACSSGAGLSMWVYPSDPAVDPYTLDLGGTRCDGLVAADFDGDGNMDLAESADYSDGVVLVFGQGNHEWSAATAVPGFAPQTVHGLAAGDVDGDGIVDLVGGRRYDSDLLAGSVTVVRGLPGGGFDEPVVVAAESDGLWMEEVAIADVNGDLRPDIVATSRESASVAVAIGFGNGEFAEPQAFELPDGSPAVATGDFDNDGIADIATVDEPSDPFDANLVILISEGHTVL